MTRTTPNSRHCLRLTAERWCPAAGSPPPFSKMTPSLQVHTTARHNRDTEGTIQGVSRDIPVGRIPDDAMPQIRAT